MARAKQVNEATASPAEPVVSEVGAGEDARKVILAEGWELTAWTGRGDTEPRIKDLDEGARLGFADPIEIRKLIRRHVAAGNLSDFDVFAMPAKTTAKGGRPAVEFWLTEAAALFIASKSETPAAVAVTKDMIRVFMLARRGLLPGQRSGLAEGDVRRIVEQVVAASLGQVVAAMVQRFEALERAIAERPDGVISTHQAMELKRQIAAVARDLVDLGDHETLKAAKAALHQQVMAASGWGGTGRSRWTMPASRYAEALAALRALQQQAERRLRRARRPKAQPKSGQLHLGLN